jgi:hypothetical protein
MHAILAWWRVKPRKRHTSRIPPPKTYVGDVVADCLETDSCKRVLEVVVLLEMTRLLIVALQTPGDASASTHGRWRDRRWGE